MFWLFACLFDCAFVLMWLVCLFTCLRASSLRRSVCAVRAHAHVYVSLGCVGFVMFESVCVCVWLSVVCVGLLD